MMDFQKQTVRETKMNTSTSITQTGFMLHGLLCFLVIAGCSSGAVGDQYPHDDTTDGDHEIEISEQTDKTDIPDSDVPDSDPEQHCTDGERSCSGNWVVECRKNVMIRIIDCSLQNQICVDGTCHDLPDGDQDSEPDIEKELEPELESEPEPETEGENELDPEIEIEAETEVEIENEEEAERDIPAELDIEPEQDEELETEPEQDAEEENDPCVGCEQFAGEYCLESSTGNQCETYPIESVLIQEISSGTCDHHITIDLEAPLEDILFAIEGCLLEDQLANGCEILANGQTIEIQCPGSCDYQFSRPACESIDGDLDADLEYEIDKEPELEPDLEPDLEPELEPELEYELEQELGKRY